MHFTSENTSDGVTERHFLLNDVPGILWTPDGPGERDRPLVLLGHGGGQHKRAPGVLARARHLVTAHRAAAVSIDAPGCGDRPEVAVLRDHIAEIRARAAAGEPIGQFFPGLNAAIAERAIPEWRAVLDAFTETGPAGYWGLSMAGAIGVRLVAAEPRITAAVLGLASADGLIDTAKAITVPVRFVQQWDDEFVPRESGLALFDAFASQAKTLYANPGRHQDVPRIDEVEDSAVFLMRQLAPPR
jgi:pimeloyl-ACP methyl ester carboxylesterase